MTEVLYTEVGEERIRLQPHALEDPSVKELIGVCTDRHTHTRTHTHTHTHTLIMTLYLCLSVLQVLLKWINDVLEERRIRVRDIVEDLYDGQVLSELMGRTPTCER